ncbi:MAG: hypothetical protein ACI4SF_12980 [Oscillospiraceae bacterium]
MQINIDDVTFIGKKMMQETAQKYMKREQDSCSEFPIEKYIELKNKYAKSNVLNTEYGLELVEIFVEGCIISYHEQLRKVLLEQSIDIGDLDLTVPGELHKHYINKDRE